MNYVRAFRRATGATFLALRCDAQRTVNGSRGHLRKSLCRRAQFVPDGSCAVVTCSQDGTIRICRDIERGISSEVPSLHLDCCFSCCFSCVILCLEQHFPRMPHSAAKAADRSQGNGPSSPALSFDIA